MNSMKRQDDRILKEELPRLVGAHYATGNQWRNNSRKNEGMEPKQKQYPVVDGSGDRSKVWCCKQQYCIGTWKIRSMNQGKLEVVKQEMVRVNVNILGIIANILNNTREDSTHGHHQMVNTEIRLIIFFAAKDGEALYSQQKQDQELTVAQIMNSLLPNSDLNWRK